MAKFNVQVAAVEVAKVINGWLNVSFIGSQDHDFLQQRLDWSHGALECFRYLVLGFSLSSADEKFFREFVRGMQERIEHVDNLFFPSLEVAK